jgi:ligand-binding sensor domain-containing protein
MAVVLVGTKLEVGRNEGNELVVEVVVEVFSSVDEVLLVVVEDGVVVLLELEEVEVDVVAGGVCETRPPVTLYAAAQAARSIPSGQHHVSPWESAVQ